MSDHLPLPKYHHIYLLLKEQLDEGGYDHGLPGELELKAHFGVARVTVRKALERLATEGLIERRRGRVTRPHPKHMERLADQSIERRGGFLGNVVTATLNTTIRVVECGVVSAPKDVADALALSRGDKVKKIVRVRSIHQGPRAFVITYLPLDLGKQVDAAALAGNTVMGLLEKADVQIGAARQTLSARLADSIVAPLLEISVGSALLTVHRVVFDQAGRPIMLMYGQFRPDRYRYDMHLSGSPEGETKIWVAGPDSNTPSDISFVATTSPDKKP